MKKTKAEAKISKVMREYKEGTLHSGKKGPTVTSRKQAIAIALSEAGLSRQGKSDEYWDNYFMTLIGEEEEEEEMEGPDDEEEMDGKKP